MMFIANNRIMNNSKEDTQKSVIRLLIISFISFIIFSIGLFPLILWIKIVFNFISFSTLIHYVLLPFIIIFSLWIMLFSEILISGVIIRLFNINYSVGQYEYSANNKMVFKWILLCQLYTPIRKILEIIPMGHIKIVYLKLLGAKIGKNSLIGGVIKDPCVTEIGDNVTIGEYALLYAHVHNYAGRLITINKVKIGNNCIIGAGAIIMPGVMMENNSILATGGIATKNHVLKKNKIYGGNPAREISITKKKVKYKKNFKK